MRPNRFPLLIAFSLTALWLACIPVEDLGEYWAKGKTDHRLRGHWRKQGARPGREDEYLSFRLDEGNQWFLVRRNTASTPDAAPDHDLRARTIQFGKHSFIMYGQLDKVFEGAEIGPAATKPSRPMIKGGLQRYSLEKDVLSMYTLDEGVLLKAIEEEQVAGHLPEEDDPAPAALARLDEKTAKFIEILAGRPEIWTKTDYQRVDNLEQAHQESRAYPATRKTRENSTVHIRVPDLKYFASGKRDVLLRFLQASPEWKVFEERGEILAYQRIREDARFTVSLSGYRSERPPFGWIQTRAMFRFADHPGGPFAYAHNRDMFTAADPLAGDVQLRLRSSDQGIESCLSVGRKGLWFEFFEQSSKEPRQHTRKAIVWLNGLLKSVREAENEILDRGYSKDLLPCEPEAPRNLQVEDGPQGGIFDIYAGVNPGEPGKCYLKVFDTSTGNRLSEDRLIRASNERVGWSPDCERRFLYNSIVTIYEGDWDHSYEARFELWFKPNGDGSERKLLDLTRAIVGWKR